MAQPGQVGRWTLGERLGAGGMGAVYLGTCDGRRAAVKVIAAGIADDPAFRGRFRREVEACRRVRGEQVATLVDAGPEDPTPWLAMEFIEGPTLRETILADGPIEGEALRAFAIAVAEGLRQIHASGVIHRDLKPSNVILAADTPVIIDFGIASIAEATSVTATGVALGSAGWMAPEQIVGESIGTPADVFAWGALVTYAATGRPPFGEGRPEALTYRIVHGDADLTGLQNLIRSVVERALARRPEERPSVEEVLATLSGSEDATQVSADITSAWVSQPTQPHLIYAASSDQPHLRVPSVLTIVTCLVIVALVAGVALFVATREDSPGVTAGRASSSSTLAPTSTRSIEPPVNTTASTTVGTTTTTTTLPEILAPATTPSAVGVCEQQLTYAVNGTVYPVLCDDGRVNRLAWDWYSQEAPAIFSLGPLASPDDVRAAICLDLSTFMIMLNTYEMLEAYHGWSFGIPPSDVITSQQTGEDINACDSYPMDGL